MQRDYQSPVFARSSRSADPFRAAHEEAAASGSGRAADQRDRSARRRIPTSTSASASPVIGRKRVPQTKITGDDLLHDLRLFVEDLSDSADMAAENIGEQVLTVEELAKQFNVSTKTISRWRELGLVSRRLVFDGRKRVGFLRSSVDRFVKNNHERVARGARFSQLTDEQRHEIIDRARRLATRRRRPIGDFAPAGQARRPQRRDDPLDDPAVRQAASRAGDLPGPERPADRSAEDADLPGVQARRVGRQADQAVRPHEDHDLPRDQRGARRADHGAAAGLHPQPAVRSQGRREGVPGPDAGERYAGARRRGVRRACRRTWRACTRCRCSPASRKQHLFRKYNYLKYKAAKLREELDPAQPEVELDGRDRRAAIEQAVATKNEIARANLRLVVSIAKRHVTPDQNFFELVSDGNMSLLRAIEKFDFARGNKFSTYASWAIMKNFARTIPGEFKHRDRFRTSQDELFAATQEHRGNPLVEEGPSSIARSADRADPAPARRARAEDHHRPVRPGSRAGAADLEGSRRGAGRDQGADPADRSPGADRSCGRRPRKRRSCSIRSSKRTTDRQVELAVDVAVTIVERPDFAQASGFFV